MKKLVLLLGIVFFVSCEDKNEIKEYSVQFGVQFPKSGFGIYTGSTYNIGFNAIWYTPNDNMERENRTVVANQKYNWIMDDATYTFKTGDVLIFGIYTDDGFQMNLIIDDERVDSVLTGGDFADSDWYFIKHEL